MEYDFEDERKKWLEYTRRKNKIQDIGLTCKEYETEIKKIVEELRL